MVTNLLNPVLCRRLFLPVLMLYWSVCCGGANAKPDSDDLATQTRRLESLSKDSWELFGRESYLPALAKSREAYDYARSTFGKNSWQETLAKLEMDCLTRATELNARDSAALATAYRDLARQMGMVKQGSAGDAEKLGADILATFDRLLGEDSYLSDLELDVLAVANGANKNKKASRATIALRLERLTRSRAKSDPDLISTTVKKAVGEQMSAQGIWLEGRILHGCLEECRTHPEHLLLSGMILHHLSRHYAALSQWEVALRYCKEHRRILGERLSNAQQMGSDQNYAIILAHNERCQEASETLDKIDELIAKSFPHSQEDKARQSLVRAEVKLICGEYESAAAALSLFNELAPESEKNTNWAMLVGGALSQAKGNSIEAERLLEAGIRDVTEKTGGEHPLVAHYLAVLAKVKRTLRKNEQAKKLEVRFAELQRKIAENCK